MIYELRIYRANPGCMPALQARFRDHTCRLFERHGITNVGYWVSTIGGRSDELWYLLSYESLAQREQAWAAFQADPEWQKAYRESEVNGRLTTKVESVFLDPTDYSPMK
jgi:hypothetical protein